MEKEIKIIVADTNWWVSLAIKKFNNKFAEILTYEQLRFVCSSELTEEIQATFAKERLQKHLEPGIVEMFWQQYKVLVNTVEVTSIVSICRDPKDNFLLSLAKDAKADFLITGDKDLLELKIFEHTTICTLTDFIEKYL